MVQEQRAGGRILVTSLAPRMWWLPLGFGLLLAVMTALSITMLVVGRGDPGQARVIEAGPGFADIVVLDGPTPQSWTVTFVDESDVQRGDVIDVRLRGDCRCEPHSDPGSPLWSIIGLVFFGFLFVVSFRSYRKATVVRAAQDRSLAVVDLGTPSTAVVVRPHFSPGSIRDVRLWLEVLDGGSGRSLGWVDIRRARATFDPSALGWLIGTPIHGADVALVTSDGAGCALASAPLATAPDPAAAWSPLVIDALEWNRTVAPGVPTVGGDGRLSVGSEPSTVPAALQEVVRSGQPGSAVRAIRTRLLIFWAVCMVTFFVVPFPWNLLAVVAIMVVFYLVASRQQQPMRSAVRAAAPELGRKEVNVVAALLLALGGRRDLAPADAHTAPPPGPTTNF